MWTCCNVCVLVPLLLVHHIMLEDLGHRFDNNTPIEETVFQSVHIHVSFLTLCIDAGSPRRRTGWFRSLHWNELLLGLAV